MHLNWGMLFFAKYAYVRLQTDAVNNKQQPIIINLLQSDAIARRL